ncbi:type VI immunity family protein [Burkholderia sp. B21-007]|uniref:type VI immunity family protein n=1 Tax=Burkholderia sp. B21-007 TaxID=2890407 RepID=UPI001E2FCCEE|nr:type VI immunity family protein [Burkholderia sp. B21-007]UEP28019.1 DUF3396 domain-containing protein [Burkholderia sp. B21-007]
MLQLADLPLSNDRRFHARWLAEWPNVPPDWFNKEPLAQDRVVIQAEAQPQTGASMDKGESPRQPAAYVLLNYALRAIVADTIDNLQEGTIKSTPPLLSTTIAGKAWLQRFNVPDDELNRYCGELHKTPKLPPSS